MHPLPLDLSKHQSEKSKRGGLAPTIIKSKFENMIFWGGYGSSNFPNSNHSKGGRRRGGAQENYGHFLGFRKATTFWYEQSQSNKDDWIKNNKKNETLLFFLSIEKLPIHIVSKNVNDTYKVASHSEIFPFLQKCLFDRVLPVFEPVNIFNISLILFILKRKYYIKGKM